MATTTTRPADRIDATAAHPIRSSTPARRRSSRSARCAGCPSACRTRPGRRAARSLNEILADSMVLYALYKKHHWLVAGPTFYQLHLLFDKHAEEQNELIDLLAERVQSLGGIAVGDPRHAAELTTIPRPPDGAEEVAVMIDRTLQAHEVVIEKVRAGDQRDRGDRGLGHERPADGRRPAPPRAPGLVPVRARRRRAARRSLTDRPHRTTPYRVRPTRDRDLRLRVVWDVRPRTGAPAHRPIGAAPLRVPCFSLSRGGPDP